MLTAFVLRLLFSSVKDHPEAILLQACVRAAQGRPELASKELERFASKYPAWLSSGITLSGWLMRDRHQVVGKRQKRWYCLKDKFLFYYREPTDACPLSGYVLETASVGQDLFGDSRDATQFSLSIPPAINYTMDAFDEKSRAEWVSVISTANLIDPFEAGKLYFSDVSAATASSIPDSMPKEPAMLEGYLSKRGNTNTDWKLRWFSLRGTLVVYYDKEGGKSLGSIDVRNSKVRQGDDGDAGFPFQIITPLRTYFLDSEFADTTRAWIVAIFNAQEDAAAKMSAEPISTLPQAEQAPYDPTIMDYKKRNSVRPSSSPSSSSSATLANERRDSVTNSSSMQPLESHIASSSSTNARKTIDPAVGRRWGSLQPSESELSSNINASSSNRDELVAPLLSESPRKPYLGGQRSRPSSLHPDSETVVELAELRAPRDSMVALASLNEEEEARRNRAAVEARKNARLDRTQSEILSEPLLTRDILEEYDQLAREEQDWCSCIIL